MAEAKAALEASGYNPQVIPDKATRTLLDAYKAAVAAEKKVREKADPIIQEACQQATVPDRVNEAVVQALRYSSKRPREE